MSRQVTDERSYDKIGNYLVGKSGFSLREFSEGQIVKHQGARDNQIYIIKSGWAMVYTYLPGGSRQVIEVCLPGDVIGTQIAGEELAVLTAFSAWVAPAEGLPQAIAGRPSIAEFFVAAAVRRRACMTAQIVRLGQRSAADRTADFLLEVDARLRLVGLTEGDSFTLPLTQNELADLLGLTPIHMSRTLHKLRASGLISLKRQRVEILNRAAAAERIGFDPAYLGDAEDGASTESGSSSRERINQGATSYN
ncbi:Crp/Fnr family transcriptional regulator [Afifella sp. IM 167]|uniref:Crp/Fnr family transcriptional regulator n=1 Tax=Afifella sp. IM 167 TaxID=2033586 RepID=UPI001CCCBD9C|nr:Crp/Fnr family transcriptional regulator [Afifella sp. IM 167]